MKKKAIEKVPFLGLTRRSRKKAVKYIGVTAVKIIGHERHLFTEVYLNQKDRMDVPLVRIVLTKKDFGTYFPEKGFWSRGRIRGTTWSNSDLIWYEHDERIMRASDYAAECILSTPEDLARIKKFCCDRKDANYAWKWKDANWWTYIDDVQSGISAKEQAKRSRRSYERRQQALKEREDNTPEIDEEQILDYADRVLFHNKHYLYYKKHGVRVRVACSKCGGVTERRWKQGLSYESQLEPMIDEPRQGYYGICPLCGLTAEWLAQGNVQFRSRFKGHIFVGQRYKTTGMVFRYFKVEKSYLLGLMEEKGQPVMGNACEELSGVEIARAYFEAGKDIQKDYHKGSPYGGNDYWDDCNLYGLSNISIREAPIFSGTYDAMQGTILQYSAMQEYETAKGICINPVEYAERYLQTPQIEMLTKLGLIKVVDRLMECRYGIVADVNANRVDAFLGIRKEHIRLLIRHQGEESILNILQTEKRLEQHWTDEQIENLAELSLEDRNGWTDVLEHMGVQKVLNLIEKYAGVKYGTGRSCATEKLRTVAQTYFDYINMRQALGYDMSNSVYLAPRDLNAAHQTMVMESNQAQIDKRIMEVDIAYPLIKAHYRRLRRKFFYEDENFVIRPARSAGEIVMEGRILHHCVGGDRYLGKHNDDISTILFLRPTTEPDVPYITVEIGTADLMLMQWYGEYDTKPDQENINRWLKSYINRLKCGMNGAGEDVGDETGQQAPAMLA